MNRIFANRQEQLETRRIFPLEQAYQQQLQWEQPVREAIAKRLFQKESEIAIWAVDSHCELHPSINSPRGSLRRKKGYEDGRHLVRAVGNCILADHSHPLIDDILSWFAIGDPTFRVTAKDVENFLSFVHQGCKRVLPASDQAMLDELMEESKEQSRLSGACWALKDQAASIASVMAQILHQAKSKTSAAAQEWLRDEDKSDFERMIVAMTDALARSPYRSLDRFTGWLLGNLLVHVDCPLETWRMRFTALQLAIGQVIDLDAVRRVEPLLEQCTKNCSRYWAASTVYRVAGLAAHQTARMFLDLHTPLEGTSPSSFVTRLQVTGQSLLQRLAQLHAADLLNPSTLHATALWCDEILPFLSFQKIKTLDVYFQALLDQVKRHADEPGLEEFCKEANYFRKVMEATDQTNLLAEKIEEIPLLEKKAVPNPLLDLLPRWIYTSAVLHLPGGRGAHSIAEFRRWLYDTILPRFDEKGEAVATALEVVLAAIQNWEESPKLLALKAMLNSGNQVIAVWAERPSILSDADKSMKKAVDACYLVVPEHPARKLGEPRTGPRDGRFLMEELVRVLAIGGAQGRERMMRWFRDEIAWTCTLPAAALQAFLDSMRKSMNRYPAIVDMLRELHQATPALIASQKVYTKSRQSAEHAVGKVLSHLPDFEQKLGEVGRESFIRDNGMTLRAIARTLWESPDDSAPLKAWIKTSIKPYMKLVNPAAINNNVESIIESLGTCLDEQELSTVTKRLNVFSETLLAT